MPPPTLQVGPQAGAPVRPAALDGAARVTRPAVRATGGGAQDVRPARVRPVGASLR
ncbi:hypothetical protein [Streptomyces sp. IBSBF 3136]|uniref:hypothetical protein n=1 Tax=Streptomyces sp. IBSBF 3136 TaxID=2903524 RepID=UPI002FDB9930